MVLKKLGHSLEWTELPDPLPGPGEIRVKVAACGVCRTDLHVVDGELPDQRVPIIPGHEIVGQIEAIGSGVRGCASGSASVFRGWAIPAAFAPIAGITGKIFAITRFSRVTRAMAASRPRRSPTPAMRSRLPRVAAILTSRRCSVPG
jgi:NADPH:quinone reductase-like Zn-dependent oxidoreductase